MDRLETQKNGLPAREIAVPETGGSNRPKPGHFGRIDPVDADEILRPLYPDLPEFKAGS